MLVPHTNARLMYVWGLQFLPTFQKELMLRYGIAVFI